MTARVRRFMIGGIIWRSFSASQVLFAIVRRSLSFPKPSGRCSSTFSRSLADRLTHHCHILETGNDSFRFKNSSAQEAKNKKEKNRNLTTTPDPKHTREAGQFSEQIPSQFLVQIKNTGPFGTGISRICFTIFEDQDLQKLSPQSLTAEKPSLFQRYGCIIACECSCAQYNLCTGQRDSK